MEAGARAVHATTTAAAAPPSAAGREGDVASPRPDNGHTGRRVPLVGRVGRVVAGVVGMHRRRARERGPRGRGRGRPRPRTVPPPSLSSLCPGPPTPRGPGPATGRGGARDTVFKRPQPLPFSCLPCRPP